MTTGTLNPAPMVISLLDFDDELAEGLPVEHRPAAALAARAAVLTLPTGDWQPTPSRPDDMGLLLLSGLVARSVRVGRRESLELLAAGDLIQPGAEEETSLIECDVRWRVLADASAARLDARLTTALRAHPQVLAALAGRGLRRPRWQAVQSAINAHPTVQERLLLTFCHLAERTGRVTRDGVVVEIPLSHRLLAQVVHAMRPSVTNALLALRSDGALAEIDRRRWLLTHAGLARAEELCRNPLPME